MANRFTEDKKWCDAWFSKLSPQEKLLFLYMIDACDLAGFIEIDVRMFTFMTGLTEIEILGAIKGLNRGYLGAKQEQWIWIKNFIKYQKNLPLNVENNAHKNIINCINSQKTRFDTTKILNHLGANQGLISPTGKVKVKVKVEEGVERFSEFWETYPKKKSKADAEKAWEKLNPTNELVDIIINAINENKKSDNWQQEDGKYIPYPASWLNSTAWLDKLERLDSKPSSINVSSFNDLN